MFGYKKGAFTDAKTDKLGRFALANGGTIFLDEIGDTTPAMQVKLLRVLQEHVFEPLGATQPVPCDVRLISATNSDLKRRVAEGSFRTDLFYRINVISFDLPPLSERREDIPLLVEHFIDVLNAEKGRKVRGISGEAMTRLMRYDYSGNIRELRNIIEHAYILCRCDELQEQCLPQNVINATNPFDPSVKQNAIDNAPLPSPSSVEQTRYINLRLLTEDEEKQLIGETLRSSGGRRSRRPNASASILRRSGVKCKNTASPSHFSSDFS